MKFRIYQIYYLLAVALLAVAMLKDFVLKFVEPNGAAYVLGNFSMTAPDGSSSHVALALGVVLSVAVVSNLFGFLVSLFSNFELQKRVSIFSMLLIAGYYILLLIIALLMTDTSISQIGVAAMLPLTALILDMLCFLSARRAEAKIIAKASGFRLRD